ncbi:MAG: cysteine desulfurase [Micavibrio aeruginosavorus]|uniref:cysteine desulfurase n=1 Tax=Micavibrio aeruginosavorus TaxID=349221 RepID=A0A2W5FQT9_9BACT|nr:MAG: cysteine desulfurase [Micavibrio aeruginosavorus]
MTKPAYLDYNASTPAKPGVLDLMFDVLKETGNASSIHFYGRNARKHVEQARTQIAGALDVGPQQIVFNSGATEGNNTILNGFRDKRVLVSAIEHPSVLQSCIANPEKIAVTKDGIVDLEAFEKQIATGEAPALVSVMLVNNETGVIQPVKEIAEIAKRYGALVHTDAVQAFGRIPFTRESLGVDFITLSSHKIGGPHGAGAICFAAKAPLPKLIFGGGQERRQRAGTENIASIAGFGLAAQLAIADMGEFQKLVILRDRIESAIKQSDKVTIYGANADRVSNTVSFSVRGIPSETQLMNYDLSGAAVSSGSACSSGAVKPSHVLTAMGASEDDAKCSIRVSLGWNSTEKDIEIFLAAWNKIHAKG